MHGLAILNNFSPPKMTNIARKQGKVPRMAHDKGAHFTTHKMHLKR